VGSTFDLLQHHHALVAVSLSLHLPIQWPISLFSSSFYYLIFCNLIWPKLLTKFVTQDGLKHSKKE